MVALYAHSLSIMVSFPGAGCGVLVVMVVGLPFVCCFGVDGFLYTLVGLVDFMVWMSTPTAALLTLCDLLKSLISVELDLYFFSFSFNSSNSLD